MEWVHDREPEGSSSLFMIDPVGPIREVIINLSGPMVQQKIDKRVTSCTHATQKRQSLLDNSQHSRVWVWRIVDQCLPASQITPEGSYSLV